MSEANHDCRVYFICEVCEDENPKGACGPREDIAVMPDGTWLCSGCYSDCDKTAYGMIASDIDDFTFPRFDDMPRPPIYPHTPTSTMWQSGFCAGIGVAWLFYLAMKWIGART